MLRCCGHGSSHTAHSDRGCPHRERGCSPPVCAIPAVSRCRRSTLRPCRDCMVCGGVHELNEFSPPHLLPRCPSAPSHSSTSTLWDTTMPWSAASARRNRRRPDEVPSALKAVAGTRDLRSSPAPVLQETLSDCTPPAGRRSARFLLGCHEAPTTSKCSALSGSPC